MATHSSVLAWRIPGMGEPGGLTSVGSHSRTRLKRLSSSNSSSIPISGLSALLLYSFCHSYLTRASLVAQSVNNLPEMGGPGSIPRWGRSPGEGNCNSLQ